MVLYTTKSSTLITISAIKPTQPQKWVTDLWRMYNYWGENHGYKVDLLEISPDEHAYDEPKKYNYVTIEVIGDGVYGALQFETGIHKLKQIDSFL